MAETRYVVAGNLIDGSGAAPRRHVFLAVQDGIISAMGPTDDLPRHDNIVIEDFSHCTLVPPLVDCSVSLARSPSVDRKVRRSVAKADRAKKYALVMQHIRYCHGHGVLGVADSSGELTDLQEQIRAEMSQGHIVDLRISGRLRRTGQDSTANDPAAGDFLRIGSSGNIDEAEGPYSRMNKEDLRRILRRRGEKKAVVVANGRQAVAEALAAGCDAIEQGYGMGEDNLRKMAALEVLWIPGVLRARNSLEGAASGGDVCCRFSARYVAPGQADPKAESFWRKLLAEQLAQLRLARELGVKTAVGTGAGSVGILHGESMVEEMKLFLKAGYSLGETIRCASQNGAGFFGMEDLGTLTVGRQATFLITRGGPRQLPRKLSYLEGIYVNGAPSAIYRKNPFITV